MANELSHDNFDTYIANHQASLALGGGSSGLDAGKSFLKFGRDGTWAYGRDGIEPDPKSVWLINAASAGWGWIAWHEGRPENEVYFFLSQPLPPKHELPPVVAKDGYQLEKGFELLCVSGPDEGEAVVYKTNSKGGLEAVRSTFDLMAAQYRNGQPHYPKVLLRGSSYPHREYGRIHKPTFEITGWLRNNPATEAEKAREPEPEPTPEPANDRPAVNGRRRRPNLA